MKAIKGLSVVLVLLVAAGSAHAGAITFFLSDKGLGEGASLGNPVITLPTVGATDTLYIWANADVKVIGMGMNVIADAPAIVQATARAIYDPVYGPVGFPPTTWYRWGLPIGQGVLGDLVTGINAVALSATRSVAGIDPAWKADGILNWEAAANAWLIGEITVQATAEGLTPVHFTVSPAFIAPAVGHGHDLTVYFGSGDAPVNGESVGVETAVADATIEVLPEPATLTLLGVGVAGLLARRRR